MTKAKKLFTTILACIMLLCTMLCTPLTASAATSSYGTTHTRTITVETKANWWLPGSESITLKQTRGTCQRYKTNWLTGKRKPKTTKVYGTWKVYGRSTDGSHVFSKNLCDGSLKINLKPNKTYKIEVSWNTMIEGGLAVAYGDFIEYPTWKVSKIYKVARYY